VFDTSFLRQAELRVFWMRAIQEHRTAQHLRDFAGGSLGELAGGLVAVHLRVLANAHLHQLVVEQGLGHGANQRVGHAVLANLYGRRQAVAAAAQESLLFAGKCHGLLGPRIYYAPRRRASPIESRQNLPQASTTLANPASNYASVASRLVRTLQQYSIPLLVGVVCALVWANVSYDSYTAFLHWSPLGAGNHYSFHFAVNDIFMALFFGIAAAEIVESCLPGGALNPPRRAINPLLGTIGGVVGPIGVYFLWVAITGDSSISRGWGVPTATDIAIAWLVARLAFGARHPAVSFLLLLAVADDGIGLGIIAVFYPDPSHPVQPVYLLIVAAAVGLAFALRRRKLQSFWLYVLGPGVLSWFGLYLTGVHPALALVPVVPFMPAAERDIGMYDELEERMTDTLNRFEHFFKLPVDFGLFAFGIANAGVVASSIGNATWAVLLALVVGKTVGIFAFSYIGHRLGFSLPRGMNPRSLLVAALTAGLGLTVALFVAGVAFTDPVITGAAKMGALLSVFVAPAVLVLARLLKVRDPVPAVTPAANEDDSDAAEAYASSQ